MDSYKITSRTWDKVAGMYQEKFMDLDLYNDTYDLFCRLVEKPEAKIFEIGCGPGNITRYILTKRPGFKLEAIDISPKMIDLARKNNPGAVFKVMDCRDLGALTDRFDAVMCGFCMPYLSKDDCSRLVKDCSSLLGPGGIAYFSTIEDDYDKSGYEASSDGQHRMYIYYHQENYLKGLLDKNNFELLNLLRKAYPKADGTSSCHIIFIVRKK